ncbi:Integrase catalytic core [Arabidopsis thaliana x Arabidopsis arenosa]|uniref:Integrase catalytic core n=1 Tax=Arabidopsis thaliana x Arabidopsis arenosa TaxID=1240361 RepID=A0A8T1XL36_9BRAS|nr:Integrase catalytic core [Arabidopsis thaliana x Arabidopsis arenosa]
MGSNEQKFDIPKFDGKGDFGSWKFKVRYQLELQGLEYTLKETETVPTSEQTSTSATLIDSGKGVADVKTETEKAKFDPDKDKRARTIICMSLGDKPLRKVMNELTALGVWKALERDYQSKSLPNRIYLKQRYGAGKSQSLTIDDVTSAAYSKEIKLKQKVKSKENSEGLFVSRGRSDKGNNGQGGSRYESKDKRLKSRQRNQPKARECWICGKEDKDALFNLKEIDGGKVLIGNNTYSEVKEIGKLKIQNPDGSIVTLTEVRYMPTMGRNLISYGQLEKNGCNYVGEDFAVTLFKQGKKVFAGKYQDGLHYLQGTVLKEETSVANRWHSRLGHMSLKNMTILVKEGHLDSKEVHTIVFCEVRVLGKSHRQSFPEAKHTRAGILEYVHSDLWGYVSNESSMSGCKYFLTLIDGYSKKVWIRFLRSKDEVFEKFSEWKKLVENQTKKKIKCLRTDNDLEFYNQQMDKLCNDSGVRKHRTYTYTLRQNRVFERMNRRISDKIRCMLAETGMEKKFWVEAVATTVCLINRSPDESLKFKIPEEVWSGSKVDYSYLRWFGCVAYVHVQQDKISPKAVKGIFVEYPLGKNGYRVWLPEEGKCIISRKIVFDKETLYKEKETVLEARRKRKVTFSTNLIQGPSACDSVQSSTGQGGADSGKTSSTGQGGACLEDKESTGQGGANSEGTESGTETNEETESEEEGESNPEQESQEEQHESLDDYMLTRDRDRRVIKPPTRFDGSHYVAYALTCAEDLEIDEPRSVGEARRSKYWKKWEQAMIEEMRSLDKNETWEIVSKPDKKKIVGCKWIFKLKEGIPGVEEARYKARLVAKGFTQVEGIDYNEIFSPVVKHVSIRIMLSVVVNFDLELEQLDVKTAFLHGTLDEVIYMNQPEGFIEKGREDEVCLLKKSLYGLKQSPREWNQKFDEFMKSQGFHRSVNNPCVYHKGSTIDDQIFLLLYVDDMLVAAKDLEKIKILKKSLNKEFEMKDLGPATRILGMDIIRDREKGVLKLSQGRYLKQVLRTFNMDDCKAVVSPINSAMKLRSLTQEELIREEPLMSSIPYASAVGSLMYAMIGSRPDLAYAICLVSRFMAKPGRDHWAAVKWILRYLKGDTEVCLAYIEGFCDSDYATDQDKRRSGSGYVFQVGENTVSWRSSLQHMVVLSTIEAEYMVFTEAAKEGIWLQRICSELGFNSGSFKLNCDSQSAICLAKNSVHHDRTKHIATKACKASNSLRSSSPEKSRKNRLKFGQHHKQQAGVAENCWKHPLKIATGIQVSSEQMKIRPDDKGGDLWIFVIGSVVGFRKLVRV